MSPEFERAINEACAALTGWYPLEDEHDGWTNGKEKRWPRPPDFATDRSALPQIWAKVETDRYEFSEELGRLNNTQLFSYPHAGEGMYEILCEDVLGLVAAPPHLHCIAALRACNAWTDDLESLWQKEQGNVSSEDC